MIQEKGPTPEEVEAEFYFKPRHYRQMAKILQEIKISIVQRAVSGRIKPTAFVPIYANAPEDDFVCGFRITGRDDQSAHINGKQSGDLLPASGRMAGIIDESLQDLVNREKTPEARREMINELTPHAGGTRINGEPHELRPLVADDPAAPTRGAGSQTPTGNAEQLDIQRGRVWIDGYWIPLGSQLAEAIRRSVYQFTACRTAEQRRGTPLDSKESRSFLIKLKEGTEKAVCLIDDPLDALAAETRGVDDE